MLANMISVKQFLSILGILFLVVTVSFPACTSCEKKKLPNVIVILIDTLRADHLGMNGYERDTSPVIDEFAAQNLNFSWAISAASWTPVSVATLFTGLYPSAHGMVPPNSREMAEKKAVRLSEKWQTMAEMFNKYGYFTAGFSSNPWITKMFGFSQGFGDNFWHKDRANAEVLTNKGKEIVERWKKNAPEKPLFMYLHYLDPHDPYAPPAPYDTRYSGEVAGYSSETSNLVNLYDGEIRYTDTKIGELFQYLKKENLYDDAVVVLLSDHGEQFMERGHQGHGFNLFNEEVHVPLIIKANGLKGQRQDVVSIADIYPTLVEILGVKDMVQTQGISLLDKKRLAKRTGVLSEIKRNIGNEKSVTNNQGYKAIFNFDFKEPIRLSLPLPQSTLKVYDYLHDIKEVSPLTEQTIIEDSKKTFFDIYQDVLNLGIGDENTKIELDAGTLNELKTLGYM